jgi:DNA-binding NtrC family response regulator
MSTGGHGEQSEPDDRFVVEPARAPGYRRVLVVDDDPSACRLLRDGLGGEGFSVETSTSGPSALAALEREEFGAVLTDLNMHGMKGSELCKRIGSTWSDLPVIVVTAFGSLDTAVEALRAGAYDFITKPFEMETVAMALERAFEHRALRLEVRRLRRAVTDARHYGELIGSSPEMRRVYDLIERIADSDSTVLITGESGTGKEVVARELHRRGKRAQGPFVAINCAAMPEALLESELFGHVRGAFTDARSSHDGLLVKASGGTLLLDEVGDMPLGIQPKLLRALQERRVRPVGGSAEVEFDARIIACTHRDLESLVDEDRFRQDLFYRINVIHVPVPPLRGRGGDLLLLAQHQLEILAARAEKPVSGFSPAAAERLMTYHWPGNVRELQNCIERAVALSRTSVVDVADLPQRIREHQTRHVIVTSDDPTEIVPLDEVEKRYVLRVLDAVAGNKSLAAQKLGLSRKTLYRRLRAYGAMTEGDD